MMANAALSTSLTSQHCLAIRQVVYQYKAKNPKLIIHERVLAHGNRWAAFQCGAHLYLLIEPTIQFEQGSLLKITLEISDSIGTKVATLTPGCLPLDAQSIVFSHLKPI